MDVIIINIQNNYLKSVFIIIICYSFSLFSSVCFNPGSLYILQNIEYFISLLYSDNSYNVIIPTLSYICINLMHNIKISLIESTNHKYGNYQYNIILIQFRIIYKYINIKLYYLYLQIYSILLFIEIN